MAFADVWGDMGPAWNVTPSVARVHGYLLAHGGVLTEREVREALGPEPSRDLAGARRARGVAARRARRRSRAGPRRGPSAVAWRVVGDRWRWFQRVAEERRAREAEPLQPRLAACLEMADAAVRGHAGRPRGACACATGSPRSRASSGSSTAPCGRCRAPRPRRSHAASRCFARLPDESLDRLLRLFGSLPEEELARTLDTISRVSPTTARRILDGRPTASRGSVADRRVRTRRPRDVGAMRGLMKLEAGAGPRRPRRGPAPDARARRGPHRGPRHRDLRHRPPHRGRRVPEPSAGRHGPRGERRRSSRPAPAPTRTSGGASRSRRTSSPATSATTVAPAGATCARSGGRSGRT